MTPSWSKGIILKKHFIIIFLLVVVYGSLREKGNFFIELITTIL